MKKTLLHWSLLISLVCLSLACALVHSAVDPSGAMRVESVDVAPAEGSGPFTASVGLPAHTQSDTLHCYIPNGPGGGQKTVYKGMVPAADQSRILTFEFTLTEPGSYELYCTAVDRGITAKTSFTVTAAPANAPAAANPPANALPLKINGSGQRMDFSGDYSCTSTDQVILDIKADGSAELETIGPSWLDHVNCKKYDDARQEAYFIDGTANLTDETVTFASCNNGGFDAQGSLKYSGVVLSGEVTCLWKQGDTAGKPLMKLTMP